MFNVVRDLWNDELSSRFYFDDRDCSPYDYTRVIAWFGFFVVGKDVFFEGHMWAGAEGRHCPSAVWYWAASWWVSPLWTHSALWPCSSCGTTWPVRGPATVGFAFSISDCA